MKIHYECFACVANQCQRIVEMATEDIELRKKGIIEAARLMSSISENSIPAIFGSEVFLGVYRTVGNYDPFRKYKELSNKLAEEIVKDFEDVELKEAIKLAIIGNVVDFAVGYSPEELEDDVRAMMKEQLYIDESEELLKELSMAKRLLYLTDNCGEIYFDLLFLKKLRETFPHLEIYIAAKDGPIINDATVEDLKKVGFEEVGKVISTGTRIVGVPFGLVSKEFMEVFEKADVIIAKGQGNFETLSERKDRRVFYLLKAKCRPIARELNLPQGSLLCIRAR
ncbi:damage-control phosphatase [Thermococcus aggregans]|uniref:Damage-control phosphatase n=1 Tax=Thermococcus aggregans TaxID=110163 RepID=A0A9E7MYU3_THEAG|nr:damage-control phosphatase [Thermococcus aggregans]USS41383.1 damage-control phosphatase [Thermococcus aggregans]